MRRKGPLKQRFEAKFTKGAEDECWEWMAGKTKDGYGTTNNNKRSYLAHRVSYSLYIGEIPKGMYVCHRCDNPSCVNPAHLFVGTQTENMGDCARKGRKNRPIGESNGRAKLITEDVIAIRASTDSSYKIAPRYNIKPSTVCRIRKGELWNHIKEGVKNV